MTDVIRSYYGILKIDDDNYDDVDNDDDEDD